MTSMSKEDPPILRIAVISTPRSGNTWARAMLADLYGLESIGLHSRAPRSTGRISPRRCVIQIHWAPWPRFVKRLRRKGVRVVVMARHPLDVLMSWLNYAYYVHQEGYCQGEGICKECAIVGALPRSEAFLNYLRSDDGRILLSFSPAWRFLPPACFRSVTRISDGRPRGGSESPGGTDRRSTGTIDRRVVEANSIRSKKPSRSTGSIISGKASLDSGG